MNVDLVVGIAHHLYEKGSDNIWDWKEPGPDSFLAPMQAAAQVTDKPLFQTEFQTDEDHGYLGGFETAWLRRFYHRPTARVAVTPITRSRPFPLCFFSAGRILGQTCLARQAAAWPGLLQQEVWP